MKHQIGAFSKLGNITVKTLRYYDQIGLLQPTSVDPHTSYRYYETSQLFQLNEIVALRQMSFSIEEIRTILSSPSLQRKIVEQKQEQLKNDAKKLEHQLLLLNHYTQEKTGEKNMNYQPIIKEIPSYIVYSAQYTIPTYADLNNVMPLIGEKVHKANPTLKCVEPDYCFNVYLDKEYKESDIEVETCQAVTSWGIDGDGFKFKEIPAITAVSLLHKGSYAGLPHAYAYAIDWAEKNGYQIAGPIRESYIDGIWNKENEEEWLTEVQVPIVSNK